MNRKILGIMLAHTIAMTAYKDSQTQLARTTEDIIEERQNKGLKSSYISKPVQTYSGNKKMSRKKRKEAKR